MRKFLIKCTKTDGGKTKDESFNLDKYEIEIFGSEEKMLLRAIEDIKNNELLPAHPFENSGIICCIQDESENILFECTPERKIDPRVIVNYIIIKLNVSKITLWSDEYTWHFEINSKIPVTNNDIAHSIISAKINREHGNKDDEYEASGFFYLSLNATVSNDFQQFGVVPWMVSIYNKDADKEVEHWDLKVYSLDELITNNNCKIVFSPGQIFLNGAIEVIERNLELLGYGLSEEFLSTRRINVKRESGSIKDENILTKEESEDFVRSITSLDDETIFKGGSAFNQKYKPVTSKSKFINERETINKIPDKNNRLEEIRKLLNSFESRKFSTCVHESGHALVLGLLFGWECNKTITNIAGKDYSGCVKPDWEKIKSICANDNHKNYDLAKVYCGGEAAEAVFYGDGSFSASNDIYSAADTIIEMLMKVTNLRFETKDGIIYCSFSDPKGNGMLAYKADDVLSRLLKDCLNDTKEFFKDKRNIIRTMACKTLASSSTSGEEIFKKYDSSLKEEDFGYVMHEAVASLDSLLHIIDDCIDWGQALDISGFTFNPIGNPINEEHEVLDKFTKPGKVNCKDYSDSQVMQIICEIAGLDLFDEKSVISIKVNEQGEAFYSIDP